MAKFNKISGNHIRPPRFPIIENGKKVHDLQKISNIIGRHFEKISDGFNADKHFKAIKTSSEKVIINFETNEDLFYNQKFSMEELENVLSNCSSSAPGMDNISFDLIKHLNETAKKFLLQFYNHLWKKGLFPKEWRHAIIIAIPKAGKDPTDVNNYRPISLTSCLCKILEKMVHVRLSWFLEKNNIISSTQFGCRKNRSTLDSLTCLEHQIRKGFEQRKLTVAILFDIQKAYDTTWRYPILRSLYNNGLRGNLPIFIKNFLSERTFQTRIDSIYSDNFKLKEGIPQGSVLSGTLFSIAINDIVNTLPKGVNNSLFVDDFAIYYTSSNLRHIQRILTTAINKIHNWATSVGFKLAIEKT